MKVKGILVFILMASFIAVAMAGTVSAKSFYVIADIAGSPTPLQAYDIQPAPNYLVYQATHDVPRYAGGAVGLAIDTDSEMLFITYENSNTIQLVDAKTMTDEGSTTAPNANNLAGIVVDQDKQKVYTVDRGTDNLYIYSWDATTKTLTFDVMRDLSGVSNAHGLALDEVNDLLYVGDMVSTNNIDVFSTADWSSVTSYTVSELVQGIAVDVKNGYIYAGNSGWYGGDRLCKYDMNSNTETYVEITTLTGKPDAATVGLAVDPVSSLLYVTTGNQGSQGRNYDDADWILVLDSNLNLLYHTGDIGNPTGICVPGKDISYNPLNLAKNDAVVDCGVYTGLTFTYEIVCDNNDNVFDVTGVTIVDDLPVELDFVSETVGGVPGTGIYDAPTHTVTWDIGTIPAGQAGPLVELEVTVNQNAIPNITIYNYCTIESDQTPPTTVIGDDPDCPPEDRPGTPILPNILVAIDIKPQSCPNPFNTKSKGVLPVAILCTEDFDATTVDPATVLLEGVAPLRYSLEDVSTPVDSGEDTCDCTTDSADGYMDMTLKFDRQEILMALGPVSDREVRVLTLTGMTIDGIPIEGQDCVVIIHKGAAKLSAETPTEFSLSSNYPNPFNPETNISFTLPERTRVTLIIYNILGERVKTLVNRDMEAGIHTIHWNGTDDNGNKVGSGIYFYRIQADEFTKTKKMILIK